MFVSKTYAPDVFEHPQDVDQGVISIFKNIFLCIALTLIFDYKYRLISNISNFRIGWLELCSA